MRWMVLWPQPVFQVPEARGADDCTISDAYSRKRHGGTGVSPSKRHLNVFLGPALAVWNWAPQVQRWISSRRCRRQSFGVAGFKRFEANVLTFQYRTFNVHIFHYAMSSIATATLNYGLK